MLYDDVKDYFYIGCPGKSSNSAIASYSINKLSERPINVNKTTDLTISEVLGYGHEEYKLWSTNIHELTNNTMCTWYLLFEKELDAKLYRLIKYYVGAKVNNLGWEDKTRLYETVDFRINQLEVFEVIDYIYEYYPELLISNTIQSFITSESMNNKLYVNMDDVCN